MATLTLVEKRPGVFGKKLFRVIENSNQSLLSQIEVTSSLACFFKLENKSNRAQPNIS